MAERIAEATPPSRAPDDAGASDSPRARALHSAVAPAAAERHAFSRIAAMAAGLFAVISVTYLIAPLHPLRPWVRGGEYVPFWNVVGRHWLGEGDVLEAEARKLAELQRRTKAAPSKPTADRARVKPPSAPEHVFPPYFASEDLERPEYGIEPPEALDAYFLKLTLTDLGVEHAIARAGHWGDSVLGVDGITSAIRRRLQRRFGDAGHGFHLMDRYHPSYRQQGIEFEPGGGWNRCLVVFECRKKQPRYGYGGLIVDSDGGAAAVWRTPKEGFGKTVSLFELWFARHERGGKLEVTIDGDQDILVDTRGPEGEDGWHKIHVEPGRHSFSVRAAGGGSVRAYGVVVENDGPGVVWDGMALIGGSTRGLRTQAPAHIASQIRHRDLDLLVFMFGGNDMERNWVDLKGSMQPYFDEYGDVIKNFRAGKPEASCLIMSLTDHGERTADDLIVSRNFAKQLADAQRRVARENDCAFFDTYEATGGKGTAARWQRAGLMGPDLGHPTGAGHELIGGLLVNAILHAYGEYRARMVGLPLPELAGASASRDAARNAKQP